jgi:integrase
MPTSFNSENRRSDGISVVGAIRGSACIRLDVAKFRHIVSGPRDHALRAKKTHKHRLWRNAKAAGLLRIRIHDLRHSFASQLVMAGVPLIAV